MELIDEREPDEGETSLMCLMVEVAGPQGPILVHRPWTASDVRDAAENLPDPMISGKDFGDELIRFCREYRPTGAEIAPDREMSTLPTQTINTTMLTALAAAITEALHRTDVTAVTTCKQLEDEPVDEFIHRLITLGLQKDITTEVQRTYVGCGDLCLLAELHRHARHAQLMLQQKKDIKGQKAQKELHMASLTIYCSNILSSNKCLLLNGQHIISYSVSVTKQPSWTQTFSGESITLTCEIHGGGNAQWEYEWSTPSSNQPADKTGKVLMISRADVTHSGNYYCMGRRNREFTQWSDVITLTVTSERPKPRLTAGPSTISVGGSVTLSCSVDGSDGWKYDWYRQTSNEWTEAGDGDNREIRVTQGGVYSCQGRRGEPTYSNYSDYVTIEITSFMFVSDSNSVSVSLQLDWTQVIRGQITVRCEIQGGGDTQWVYDWETTSGKTITQRTDTNYWTVSAFSSGGYRCRGTNRQDSFSSTWWSEPAALTVSGAVLTFDPSWSRYFTGESVTFTCDMKDDKRTDWETRLIKDGGEIVSYSGYRIKALSTGNSGRYQCFSVHRKTNHIKTSGTVKLIVSGSNKVVVTLHPNWTQLFRGETITVRCEIEDRGDTEWEYEWKTQRTTNTQQNEVNISSASSSHSGNYSCRGRMRNAQHNTTEWSQSIRLSQCVFKLFKVICSLSIR
ncbi:Fc receptor-like protein 5 [Betta splendens]|uniref:Fc receptor-like protein 5 n=1 Tax=Betta splendens TaxID=158456 RepID=A0A9W2XA14_BETSP|nr:Fc receptor-like protein 5 [Betta splendens]